jgi:YidC/Oxa1 family membrane protein insertase
MSGIFEIFAIPFGWIMWACYSLIKNYGVALILFTIITKAVLLPLSIKQQKSSAKMAYIRPKMEAIQKRYANNREKQGAELQKLYEEEGYSPTAGCLPMLITFPVLFGVVGVVYYPLKHILRFAADTITHIATLAEPFVAEGSKLQNYPELKILSVANNPEFQAQVGAYDPEALSALSSFDNNFLGIDFSALPSYTSWLILVPIFAAVAGFLTSFISMRTMRTDDNAAAGTGKVMMLIMPLITFFFAMGLPCGIGFYWIISNIVAMIQSVILSKFYNPKKLAEQYAREQEEKKAKKKAKKAAETELRKKMIDERNKHTEEKLSPEEAAEKKKELEDARQKLRAARMRDAEKYGEVFVDVTDDDLK